MVLSTPGLHVDTGQWVDTKREDRLCQVCQSFEDVEDEQHFLFSCPAYSDDVRQKYASLLQQAFSVSDFLTHHLVLFDVLHSVCWPPVGSPGH